MTDRQYATPFDQANDIAQALLTTRVFLKMSSLSRQDELDERQELSAHLLKAIARYDPSKGAVSTWTYAVFRHWLWERVQRRQALEQEIPWDPCPVEDRGEWLVPLEHVGEPLHDNEPPAPWSDEAHELLGMLPEKVQAVAALKWGEGYGTVLTSELLGCTRRTVNRHMAEAEAFVEELRAA